MHYTIHRNLASIALKCLQISNPNFMLVLYQSPLPPKSLIDLLECVPNWIRSILLYPLLFYFFFVSYPNSHSLVKIDSLVMDELWSLVDDLNLTIDVGDLIERGQVSSHFIIAFRIVLKNFFNAEALLRVHQMLTKIGELDLKEVDQSMFILYFEHVDELELVLW